MTSTESVNQTAAVERTYVQFGLSYDDVVAAFEAAVGHLDPKEVALLIQRGATWTELDAEMTRVAGPSGLMILATFNQGAVASVIDGQIRCRLYLVGNPAIAARIVRIDARASLYVPFRVAIYVEEGSRATTISFDRPSSSLGVLCQQELQPIGLQLDAKIDAVVQSIRQRAAPDPDAA